MSDDFRPQNELEHQLIAAQDGGITPESFIETLVGSEVFMPIHEKHRIGGLQTQEVAHPLRLRGESGDEVLVLFTSPERAKGFVRDHPGYGGGLVVEFTWVLDRLGIGYGVSLNPGLAYGIDFEAQDLAQIAGWARPN